MESNSYTIVVGSGISGLTSALLLAKQGHNIAIVEATSQFGGYLNRFKRNNLFFDTGFHFTGGLRHVFPELLQRLGIQDDIVTKTIPVTIFLNESNQRFNLPNTTSKELEEYWIRQFPAFKDSIKRYYQAINDTVINTPVTDLSTVNNISLISMMTDYDLFTVDSFLDHLNITDPALRTVLTTMSVCHGSSPSETPLPYHARCTYNLDNEIVTIQHGGNAFISAFMRELKKFNTRFYQSTVINNLTFNQEGICTRAVLSNGDILPVNKIIFTVAPQSFQHLLPDTVLSTNAKRRIKNLQPTCSFFSIYGVLDDKICAKDHFSLYFEHNNVSDALLPNRGNTGVGMVTINDIDNEHTTFTAFKTCFPEEVYEKTGVSPDKNYRISPEYRIFKKNMIDSILDEVYTVYPEYRGHLKIVDSASPLTCKRYIPPIGSAYGTRQIMAKSRLPFTLKNSNCHILGHHTQYPGILGSMLSAFSLFPI